MRRNTAYGRFLSTEAFALLSYNFSCVNCRLICKLLTDKATLVVAQNYVLFKEHLIIYESDM